MKNLKALLRSEHRMHGANDSATDDESTLHGAISTHF
jgi:hypothetical protein